MKGMKGKLLKKLKTIKAIGYLKPDRILQVNASDGYIYTSPPRPISTPLTPLQLPTYNEQTDEPMSKISVQNNQEPEVIDVSELMKDLEDQQMEVDDGPEEDKENVRPGRTANGSVVLLENGSQVLNLSKPKIESLEGKECKGVETSAAPLSEISNFRRPDLDSKTLFDPQLLAAFEKAVMEVKAQEAERRARTNQDRNGFSIEEEPPLKARKLDEFTDPLLDFEEICPPGGVECVVLYTTGLRGIRKTFEDCHSIKSLLENFRILFFERDVSMHSEFKEELWRIMGGKVVPPRLFIKGRYIGGAEEVLRLHEQGKFKPLLEGIPRNQYLDPCEGCSGIRFIVCFNCHGGKKIIPEGDGEAIRCSECNENGLILCPFCC